MYTVYVNKVNAIFYVTRTTRLGAKVCVIFTDYSLVLDKNALLWPNKAGFCAKI